MIWYCLSINMCKKLTITKLNNTQNKMYYYFKTKREAVSFWRYFFLDQEFSRISKYFSEYNKHYDKLHYHIYIRIINTKTKKIYQYIIFDINYEHIMDKIRHFFHYYLNINEHYNLIFDYKVNKFSHTKKQFREALVYHYQGCNILYNIHLDKI